MRIDQVKTYTPDDIDRLRSKMSVRRSSTGKRHLFPAEHFAGVAVCGKPESLFGPPLHRADDWETLTGRCMKCDHDWSARLKIAGLR